MGLGKDKGSSRINRYEHQVTAIGFDNLQKLAEVLEVPVAYLLTEDEHVANAILALTRLPKAKRPQAVELLQDMAGSRTGTTGG